MPFIYQTLQPAPPGVLRRDHGHPQGHRARETTKELAPRLEDQPDTISEPGDEGFNALRQAQNRPSRASRPLLMVTMLSNVRPAFFTKFPY